MTAKDLYDSEAEAYLIGSCLIDFSVLNEVRTFISAKDFMTLDNQLIFDAMLEVADEYGECEPVLVSEKLKKKNNLNRVGGNDRLYELQAFIAETQAAVYYAKIVEGFSMRRRVIASCSGIISKAKDYSIEPDDLMNNFYEEAESVTQSSKSDLTIKSARDLSIIKFEPVKWLIPNLLPAGLTVLAGPAKIGKSFLCWNIAFSVAMGGIALSDIEVEEKRNVLYLALDDDEALLQSRHSMILGGETPPENVFIVNSQNLIKFDATGLRKIERIVDDNRIELMIVDTLAHVRPEPKSGKHKTSYDIDYQSLMPIHQFAHRKNMGIILVTHTRKSVDTENPFNQIQGSTGIQAGCDSLFMLTKNKSQGNYVDLHITGRRMQSKDITLELCQGGIWKVIGEPDDFIEQSPESNEVLSVLARAKGDPLTPSEIAEELGIEVKTCQMRLKKLVGSGEAVKVGHGQYIHTNYNTLLNTA